MPEQGKNNDTNPVLARMLLHDHFTRWLGLTVTEYRDGYCKLSYIVKKDMLNGFGTIHGGVLFSASDSAFAFACNTDGVLSVALDATINFVKPANEEDILVVEAKRMHRGNRTGFYDVVTTDEQGNIVCMFRGTAYISGKTI